MFQMDDDDIPGSKQKRRISFKSIRWSSGACNSQGRCKYNEDRCVHLPNATDAFLDFAAKHGGTDDEIQTAAEQILSGHRQPVGYFGVYDGHDGAHAATYMEKICHIEIMK
jgi:hypothetical protein